VCVIRDDDPAERKDYPLVTVNRDPLPAQNPVNRRPQPARKKTAKKNAGKVLKFAGKAIKNTALAVALLPFGAVWLAAKAVKYTAIAAGALFAGAAMLGAGALAFAAASGLLSLFVATPVAIGITAGIFALGAVGVAAVKIDEARNPTSPRSPSSQPPRTPPQPRPRPSVYDQQEKLYAQRKAQQDMWDKAFADNRKREQDAAELFRQREAQQKKINQQYNR
jgi:hypothetical protein